MWQEKGFYQNEPDVIASMKELEGIIEKFPDRFLQFSEEEILHKPAPGKWSKKEILGHLIDSALNNLKRFTEIQFLPEPYIVPSYDQDKLVQVNHYQQLPSAHLFQLWKTLNQQIIYVVKEIPSEKLPSQVNPRYDSNEMKNLGWIICDYVAHLQHHLKQIFPA